MSKATNINVDARRLPHHCKARCWFGWPGPNSTPLLTLLAFAEELLHDLGSPGNLDKHAVLLEECGD